MNGTGDRRAALRKVLVVGLGNPDRGDDGIGATVAHDLAGRVPADVPVVTRRGDMLSLIDDWAGFDGLVCVDAAAPVGLPGRISRINVNAGELPGNGASTSSHALGLAAAIDLARTLQLAPRDIIVYAVEGGSFDDGAQLSPAVAAAAREVADRVLAEVDRLRHDSQDDAFDA